MPPSWPLRSGEQRCTVGSAFLSLHPISGRVRKKRTRSILSVLRTAEVGSRRQELYSTSILVDILTPKHSFRATTRIPTACQTELRRRPVARSRSSFSCDAPLNAGVGLTVAPYSSPPDSVVFACKEVDSGAFHVSGGAGSPVLENLFSERVMLSILDARSLAKFVPSGHDQIFSNHGRILLLHLLSSGAEMA